MRLICPNCGAEYEVPAEVIPAEGRDVQCSACATTWFQAHPDHDQGLADEIDAPSLEPVAAPPEQDEAASADHADSDPAPNEDEQMPAPARRELDANISDVLREEAEFEAAARAADENQALESQPDLGLDTAAEGETERRARERMARLRGEDVPPEVAVANAKAAAGSRRDLLPDIEEINSTLRSAEDRQVAHEPNRPAPVRKKRGFRRGFMTMVFIAILMAVAYIFAPEIAKQVPQADPYLSTFVTYVDEARTWLDGQLQSLAKWLDTMAASQSEG